MIYLLLTMWMSFFAFSAEKVELLFPEGPVKQGAMITTQLKVDSNTVQALDFQKLKGQTLGKTIYFYSVSPLMRKDGETSYEAEAKVIFVIPTEDSILTDTVQGKEVQVKWNPIKVEAIEAQKSFLFADFDVSYPKSFLSWILAVLGIMVVSVVGWIIYKRITNAKLIKAKKLKMKAEIFEPKTFEDIVNAWKKKRIYIQMFPHLEEPFSKLESTLFKYQFKQQQSASEKEEVVRAYENFLTSIQGGFDGI